MAHLLLEKNRVEFFSDAVFAIIITVMIIEFHPPEGHEFVDLIPLAPTFLAYILSFLYISVYWNNHHHLLKAAKGVNSAIMWSNLVLLFFLTLIPFATIWMGENPTDPAPTALYGIVLLLPAIVYNVFLQGSILKTLGKNSTLAKELGKDYKGRISPILYILGIIAAFYNTALAQIIFAIVAVMWIRPDKRIEWAIYRNVNPDK